MVMKTVSLHAEQVAKVQSKRYPTYFEYRCQFIVNGEVIDTLKVVTVDIACDYEGSYAPSMTITVAMILSDYESKVYPNRNKLTATITKVTIADEATVTLPQMSNVTEYSVVPLENVDIGASANVTYAGDLAMGSFTFQLIPLPIEKLRLETVGGVYVDSTALDVLKVLLGNATKRRATTSANAYLGFTATEQPKEVKRKAQLIIKHGTFLLDLPTYLQKHCGGIYNHSIGCYFHNKLWYTFPLYDTSRYNRTARILDIAVLPQRQAGGIDKTYSLENNRAFVLITGSFSEIDDRDIKYLNQGNGVRFANATQMFDSFTTSSKNVATTDLTKNVSQFVLGTRETGDQSVPFSSKPITDNVCHELSKISQRLGTVVTMHWKYANPDILYPGMPVKVHFPDESGTKERLGVLLASQTFLRSLQPELTAKRMGAEVSLKVFLAD